MTRTGCSRCGAPLVPPGPFDSSWRCSVHGPVGPLRALTHVGTEAVDHAVRGARVPVWLPQILPAGWRHCGTAVVAGPRAHDERSYRAVLNAFSVPNPPGATGRSELLVIAEEPGLGVGASYAGLPGARDAAEVDVSVHLVGESHARVSAAGRSCALWSLPSPPDRCAYLGEAAGVWLWFVGFPAEVGWILLDPLTLVDARDRPPAALDSVAVTDRVRLAP